MKSPVSPVFDRLCKSAPAAISISEMSTWFPETPWKSGLQPRSFAKSGLAPAFKRIWQIFVLPDLNGYFCTDRSSVFCQNRQQKNSANREIWNIGRSWAAQCKAVWPWTPPLSKSVTENYFPDFQKLHGSSIYILLNKKYLLWVPKASQLSLQDH